MVDRNLIRSAMETAVTRYDRKQSTKKFYNVYALAIYLRRVDEIMAGLCEGDDWQEAVRQGFTGSLQTFILKFVDKAIDEAKTKF